jgi:hypothetical protein
MKYEANELQQESALAAEQPPTMWATAGVGWAAEQPLAVLVAADVGWAAE